MLSIPLLEKLSKLCSCISRWMMPWRVYQYKPLPTDHHIRVLTITSSTSPKIHATLAVVDESAAPRYQCLSYTWGPPRKSDTDQAWFKRSRRIVLDGIDVSIQPNLDDALHHLRRLDICGPIWIDALCINQEDQDERGSQVSKMHKIYENANEVNVWLGTEHSGTVSAIHSMKLIGVTSDEIMEKCVEDKLVNLLKDNVFSDDNLIDVFEFSVEFNWFTRIWTVQELVLAREVKFMCGTTILKLETIWGAEMLLVIARAYFEGLSMGLLEGRGRLYLENLRHARSEKPDTSRYGIQLSELVMGADVSEISEMVQNKVGMKFLKHSRSRMDFVSKNRDWTGHAVFSGFGGLSSLLEFGFLRETDGESRPRRLLSVLAQELREKEATDPRDKLYSILGISSSTINDVNYSKSAQQVFTEAATLALTEFQDLSCLSYIGSRETNRVPQLPSWVPDYTVPLTVKPLASSSGFRAGTTWQFQVQTSINSPCTLALEGVHVDTVTTLCAAHWTGSESNGFPDLIKLALNPIPVFRDPDLSFIDLLRNTLHAEFNMRTNTSDPAAVRKEMEESFQRWLFRQTYLALARQDDQLASSFLLDPRTTFKSAISALGISGPLESLTGSLSGDFQDETWISLTQISKQGSMAQLFSTFSSAFERDTFTNAWADVCTNRSIFRTEKGYLGLGPSWMLPGDRIHIIKGAAVPYVFRPIPLKGESAFELEGDIYIRDIMDGQAEARLGIPFHWTEIVVY